jgi:hypothetical protein
MKLSDLETKYSKNGWNTKKSLEEEYESLIKT